MATVTGFTAERMLAIEQNTIVSARREGSDLILTTFGGVEINLGNVNGRGVQSTTVAYQISTSASATPIGPWFTEMPQLLPGYYLWTKTTMSYTDNTSTPMYTVARIGQDGNAGSPPRTPNNLTVVSNTGFFDNTGAVALIVLSWDPVDMGLDAEGLEIASYEVFGSGSRFISAVTEPVIGLTVPSGKVDQYQVRALSTTGLYGDLTVPIEVTAATPASNTRQPTPPTLSSAMSTVVAKWDGSYLSGGLVGAHTVVVEIQNGSDWVQQGPALTSAGSVSFNAVVGSTVSVRLRAYDQLQRLTGTSTTATITVLGVALQDIDQAFNDALNDTNLATNGDFTNGKSSWGGTSTVVTSSTEPNYMLITTAASGNNDQPSEHRFAIEAGEQFYVSFEVYGESTNTTWNSANVHLSVTKTPSGTEWPSVSIPAATIQASPNTWLPVSGTITAPAGSRTAIVEPAVDGNGTAGNKYRFRKIVVRRKNTGELIVDGSILARHVEMDTAFADKFWVNEGNFGKINTNMITNDFGSQINILSNEGITFIAGELATQGATIADLDLIANDALSTAQFVETDVATALATAETANGAALLAKTSADGANDRITEHQSVFKITPTGAVISTVNAEQELRLNPSSIELAQNGIAISRWEAGRFIVNETIMNKAQIAEHSFEVYSAKRTIIRPI